MRRALVKMGLAEAEHWQNQQKEEILRAYAADLISEEVFASLLERLTEEWAEYLWAYRSGLIEEGKNDVRRFS